MKTSNRVHIAVVGAMIVLAPTVAFAQVVINEIAWMGSINNANAEWIELRNTGASPAPLEGWTLVAEDDSPTITLTGTIAGNGFFLLERTSDESVPGINADLIYTGVLGNGGETLLLKDGDGKVIDTVTGGENWEHVGGNNATKETGQKNGSAWITAAPTPRALNASADTGEESVEEVADETGAEAPAASVTGSGSSAPAPSSALVSKASAGKDRVVVVGVENRFEGVAYDSGGRTIEDAHFVWNFGDGSSSVGKVANHRWEYPGRYAVVLEVSRFESKASHRIIITAETANFLFEVSADGGVIIKNLSNRDVDLSSWRIADRGVSFTFSQNTIVLKGGSMRLSPFALRFNASHNAELRYPDGRIAAAALPPPISEPERSSDSNEEESEDPATSEPVTQSAPAAVVTENPAEHIETAEEVTRVSEDRAVPPDRNTQNVAAAAMAAEESGLSPLWWVGMLAVVLLGVAGVLASRRLRRREWTITEDTSNDV